MYNQIAFLCNYCSISNPSKITIYYSSKENDPWIQIGVFQLQKCAGWQSFTFKSILSTLVGYLRIELNDSFGSEEIYLNQISLKYFISLESSMYEQLNQEMHRLRNENESMMSKIKEKDVLIEDLNRKMKLLFAFVGLNDKSNEN